MTGRRDLPASALFAWPAQAAVGRVVPKTKIYAHTRSGTALRNLFVTQVEQITWAYKLAPETVNLPASPAVPEIQVFRLTLKTSTLDHAVLRAIDRAVPFPILYELHFAGRSQAVAAYKRPSTARDLQWVTSDYFESAWQLEESSRPALPISVDLESLYHQLVRSHLPLSPRAGESLTEHIDRCALVRRTEADARKLATDLAREAQFNRKININAELRTIRTRLANLTR